MAVACKCFGKVWWVIAIAVGNIGPRKNPAITRPAASAPMEVACHINMIIPHVTNKYNVIIRFSPNMPVI
jgi:hypothetical protein